MRQRLVSAAGCAVVAVLAGLTSCSSGDDDPTGSGATSAEATAPASTGAPDYPVHPVPAAAVTELADPDWLADAGDAGVWVKLDHGPAVRLDPATGATVTSAAIGGELCQGLGAGLGYVWSCWDDDLARIDPATGEVQARFPVAKARQQGTIPVADGRVWVLTGDGSTLLGLDPVSGAASSSIPLGARGTDVAVGAAGLWVVSSLDGQALRVDPASGTVDRRVEDLEQPTAVAVTDQVWVSGGSTARIDPDTGEVLVTSPLASGQTGGLAIGDGRVWVRSEDRFLVALDTDDGTPLFGYDWPEATSGGDVLLAGGVLWATAYNDFAVFRLDPDPTG